ncbi:peptidoglycan-binding domain-containing protein [Clostridioides difficile]
MWKFRKSCSFSTIAIKKVGYALEVDSQFGNTTLSKVKSFQGSYGLTVDGIVGSATWKNLHLLQTLIRIFTYK